MFDNDRMRDITVYIFDDKRTDIVIKSEQQDSSVNKCISNFFNQLTGCHMSDVYSRKYTVNMWTGDVYDICDSNFIQCIRSKYKTVLHKFKH